MKTLIAAGTMMMFSFSFGMAFAADDQMPTEFAISNLGPIVHDRNDWSVKGANTFISFNNTDQLIPLGKDNELGIVLARDAEAGRDVLADTGAKGAAAGGVTGHNRMTPTVGSRDWYGLPY